MQAQQIGQLGLGDAKGLARGAEVCHSADIFLQAYPSQADYSRANSLAPRPLAMRWRMKNPVLAGNVAALRKHLGMKQEVFAERVCAAQSSVSKWESRGDMPEARPLAAMAELAGTTVAKFLDEKWSPPRRRPVADIAPTRTVDAGETVEIIMLDLSVSMGPGSEIHGIENFVEGEPIQFDLALLRSITSTPPHRLRLIKGVGDSMFPTLLSGDRVMVDLTEQTYSRLDGVYWVNHLGAQGIKRLRGASKGRIIIKSDNPTVPDNEIDAADLLIHGRAIWFAREL
jgi:phage repressor protein C with HTH and peptisase S24 domain